MVKSKDRSSARFNSRSVVLSYLHYWFNKVLPSNTKSCNSCQKNLKHWINWWFDMINNWVHKPKIKLHSNPWKQAQDVTFKRKNKKVATTTFNNSTVAQITSQNYIRVFFDSALTFDGHLSSFQCNSKREIGFLRKSKLLSPRSALTALPIK